MTLSREEGAVPVTPVKVSVLAAGCGTAADAALLQNQLREWLRAACKDLADWLEYVHAIRPIDPVSRIGACERRVCFQQEIEAVGWRAAGDLLAVGSLDNAPEDRALRVALLNRARAEECAAIERDATKAGSQLLSVFASVAPRP